MRFPPLCATLLQYHIAVNKHLGEDIPIESSIVPAPIHERERQDLGHGFQINEGHKFGGGMGLGQITRTVQAAGNALSGKPGQVSDRDKARIIGRAYHHLVTP